ncbi:MAG: T9SS type A sorting domain-containing protein, partial [FCB group bacterium]
TVHFRDDNLSFDAGVAVSQKVYQFNDSTKRNFIIVNYDIINQSGSNFDSLYAALYFDWDIGPSGNNNQALYDNDNVFGWVMNVKDTSMPLVGVSLLSSDKLNYYAIDNPTVWDGFTNSEKWMMMTSGVYRKQSGITDVSMVIGAGPIRLNANDTAHVAFSIFVGNDIAELKSASRVARETAIINGIANGNNTHLPPKDSILSLYPNPAPGNSSGTTMSLLLALTNGSNITIDIVDVLGNVVHTVIENQYFTAGIVDHPIMIPVSTLSQGRYFLRISTIDGQLLEPFTIIR